MKDYIVLVTVDYISLPVSIDNPSKERRMSQATVHRYTLIAAGKLSILSPYPLSTSVRA
jgi:hypothetical protein